MISRTIVLILFSIFIIPLTNAQIVFESETLTETTEGLFIAFPSEIVYQKESQVTINAFLFNHSGILLNASVADCNINVFDERTNIIRQGLMGFTGSAFNYTIDPAITRRVGEHRFIVFCNTSNSGSFRTGGFDVTESGTPERKDEMWIMIIAFIMGLSLLLIGLKVEDFSMTTISGFIFVGLGIYIYLHGFLGVVNFVQDLVAGILMIVGAYIAVRPNIEYIQNNLR